MPSCVPATAIDDNGCTLTAEDMAPYLHNSRILGLGEVMDSISVVQGEKSMHDKLELFEGRIRDGHAPFLEEGDLRHMPWQGLLQTMSAASLIMPCENGGTVLPFL